MGAGTWESHHAITALLYRYTELIDAADFEGIGRLFARGEIRSTAAPDPQRGMKGAQGVRDFYARSNRVHDDGTLRTRHVCCNVIVDIDEAAGTATARSAYVVFQATDALALQPIVAGRYEDRFARDTGAWHFVDRLIHVDQVGDVSQHLNIRL